jgi:type VI secretion system secreted protein Hcp
MAVSGWMKITAQKQKNVSEKANTVESVGNLWANPECKLPEKIENLIQVIATTHEVELNVDRMSGMATGRRVHKPYVVTKLWDRATPLLYKALTQNEVMDVEIYFPRPEPSGQGGQQHYYTVKLTNAVVISIRSITPSTNAPETANLPQTEDVSFTYDKIKWEMLVAKTEQEDAWKAKG